MRLLTEDDPKQAAAARAICANSPIWIAKTVLLEADWLLLRLYGFDASVGRESLIKLLGMRNVQVEDQSAVVGTMALASQGLKFADALHLCRRPRGATFTSCDRALVRRAKRAGLPDVTALGGN